MNTIGTRQRATAGRLACAFFSLTAILLAAGVITPRPADAAIQSVTLHAAINYTGDSIMTSDHLADLRTFNFNDVTSSIQLAPGTVVAAYDAINFSGRCETFRVNDADLRNNVIGNDTISSIRVGQPCPVTLFGDNNFTGIFLSASNDIPDLGLRFSDVMSSIRLQGNTVALFDHPNYGGMCEVVTADDASFDNNPIRERVSSLRFNVGCPKQAILYTDIWYGGPYLQLPLGRMTELIPNSWQNRTSSIYLTGGASVEATNSLTVCTAFGCVREIAPVTERFNASAPDLRLSLVGNDTIDYVTAYG